MTRAAFVALALVLAACSSGGRGDAKLTPVHRHAEAHNSISAQAETTTSMSTSSTSAPSTTAPPPTTAKPTPAATAAPVPAPASGCSIFPADNPWNTDISRDAVSSHSDAWVASIGTGVNVHPDVGTEYGIPYVEVPASQPRVPVSFEYADESDPGPYPIPPNAPVEGGSDRHVLVLDRQTCRLWELYDAATSDGGRSWHAGSGATWDLRSNALRPDGWTSADAAGLPILPGLIRYDEVAAGHIDHAVRFTAQHTQRGYIHPATHYASSITDSNVPPMGARFRLKASYDCSPFSRTAQIVCAALKRYGMLLADNGSNWYLTGAPDRRWSDDELNDLKRVPGSAFEAVDTGPVITR